jgi:hypothetical protein
MVLSLKAWKSRSLPGLQRTEKFLDTMIELQSTAASDGGRCCLWSCPPRTEKPPRFTAAAFCVCKLRGETAAPIARRRSAEHAEGVQRAERQQANHQDRGEGRVRRRARGLFLRSHEVPAPSNSKSESNSSAMSMASMKIACALFRRTARKRTDAMQL